MKELEQKYKVKADTVIRTLILAVALINSLLSAAGKAVIPIEDEVIEALVSYGFLAFASIMAWWKNNSFSQAALHGDKHKTMFKDRP